MSDAPQEPKADAQATAEKSAQTKTAIQMKNAPRGAIYVCPNGQLLRYKDLSKVRGVQRPDLFLIEAGGLDNGNRFRGMAYEVVVDHAAKLTEKQQAIITEYETLRKARL